MHRGAEVSRLRQFVRERLWITDNVDKKFDSDDSNFVNPEPLADDDLAKYLWVGFDASHLLL